MENGKGYRTFQFSTLLPDHIGLSAIQFYNELAKIARTNKATELVSGSTLPIWAIFTYILSERKRYGKKLKIISWEYLQL